MEIWKDIKGYEGLYQVSNLGRVKSLDREITYIKNGKKVKAELKGKILINCSSWNGYKVITIRDNASKRQFRVHRLVAEAFIPNPENKPYIDHINTNKTDNRVENLRWVTRLENSNNELTKEKHSKYMKRKNPNSKRIMCLETKEIYSSSREAERKTGIYREKINKCCKNIIENIAGKHYMYIE